MKNGGKAVLVPQYFPSESEPPCPQHPSSSRVGICALCLKERLLKLVSSDSGEHRLSSCTCSDISSNISSVEVGTVYPISLLMQNDIVNEDRPTLNHARHPLKRSSSTCMDGRRSSFWHLGWLSRRKSECGVEVLGRRSDGWGENCKRWDSDHLGRSQKARVTKECEVIQSRPAWKVSSVTVKEEGDETDSEFFDLNVELLSSKTRPRLRENKGIDVISRATSCRITVNEIAGRGSKIAGRGSNKVLKWMFRQQYEKKL